ncbi:MAG: hypothetical protein H0X37_11490 [Herpetosiphonaceae bacterium]|nr:hypothetical protein [Herpetosiphonaceae bacterium]
MTLEMVMNELSLRTPAADVRTAQQRMMDLVATLREARKQRITVLRTHEAFQQTLLAPNYLLVQWRNDPSVDRDTRTFFRTISSKSPYLADLPDVEEAMRAYECIYDGELAQGLSIASQLSAIALSVLSNQCWDCSRINLEASQLDDSGEIVTSQIEVIHAARAPHILEHLPWIEQHRQVDVRDGMDLWGQREELFPNLAFCEDVRRQLQQLRMGNPMLELVLKHIAELQHYAESWQSGSFDYTKIPGKVSPESESTLNQFSKERTFRCPDGQERVFSWHLKINWQAWRIHFIPEPGKIIIGYVGPHLP